ncbi:hypothetical protein HPP92_009300 [Vanilla planifolia]|uniref:Pentatricopeptide repeat-containing protein n=1 Tax=Vanilla planifolia TaxID=51239 RepID=A0A835R9R7_VANPL|nr:hypothetical protein HPP92_009300 [Vanilla planifolia]
MKYQWLEVCKRYCWLLMLKEPSVKQLCRAILPESNGNWLVFRFSETAKQFSRRRPIDAPVAGSRPRHCHRFEYSKLMNEFKQAGKVEQVLRLLQEMKDLPLWPDVVNYTIAIDSLVMADLPVQALSVFKEMISTGLAPDSAFCTVLVKLYCFHLKDFASACEVIMWMKNHGCNADTLTYTTLINGLCLDGRVEQALGVLDYMLEDECPPNVYTFTPIVHAYCSKGRLYEAKELMSTMENVGCLPNNVTYNVLIEALCRNGEFGEVDKVLRDCKQNGWKPDEITYSIYMNGLCKWGRVNDAFQQLDVMLSEGVLPNAVTVNILLDCLCRASMTWKAKCLLEKSAELEWDADVINYNTVMSRLGDAGSYWGVLKLFTDMLKKGIPANARTISIVIYNLRKAGKLVMAKCILDG